MKPVAVLELFGGCGSATSGFIEGGAFVVISFDNWDDAVAVHRSNIPAPHQMIKMEMGTLQAWNAIKGWVKTLEESGFHVHIHASPPCQAFSVATSTDPREGCYLLDWTLGLIEEVDPDSWSMENVLPVRKYLPDSVNFEVVNCADYGVPQTRKRAIAGCGFTLTPTHENKWVSILDALPHLKDALLDENVNPKIKRRTLNDPSRTITSQSSGQLRVKLRLNMDGCGASMSRRAQTTDCLLDEPAKTVKGACGPPSIRLIDSNALKLEAMKVRSMSMAELATLQGFSDDYDFSAASTQKSRWQMIGNALPRQITRAIMEGVER